MTKQVINLYTTKELILLVDNYRSASNRSAFINSVLREYFEREDNRKKTDQILKEVQKEDNENNKN